MISLPKSLKRMLTSVSVFISVVGIILLIIYITLKDSQRSEKNPYEYNIDIYKKTPEKLILYKEDNQIKIDLKNLYGLAVDERGRIFVTGDTTVLILKKDGELLNRFDLNNPARCITVDKAGDIFLGFNEHIEVYDKNGRNKAKWESIGEKAIITSIAVRDNNVFAADYGHHIVWHFNKAGRLIGTIKSKNRSQKIQRFIIPSPYFDLASGRDSSLWVVNPGRHLLENYTIDGKLITSWGKPSMNIDGFTGCCNPIHIAIGPDGDFFTVEKGLIRVKVYSMDGKFKGFVAGTEQFKPDTVIEDLAIDFSGRVLVLDPKLKAVRIFSKKKISG